MSHMLQNVQRSNMLHCCNQLQQPAYMCWTWLVAQMHAHANKQSRCILLAALPHKHTSGMSSKDETGISPSQATKALLSLKTFNTVSKSDPSVVT
jgi:hypothetical protein